MATEIQWTDETWNPVTGCTKVSPGCANCYAETVANRFWASQYEPVEFTNYSPDICGYFTDMRARKFTDVLCHEDRLSQPLAWRKPRKVFVNSMSDLFHADVPDAFIDRVYAVMALSPQHTFQVLTKRAERMRDYFAAPSLYQRILRAANEVREQRPELCSVSISDPAKLPPRWIWLGVSVENDHFMHERIALLKQTPAAVRFISVEPLLERLHGLDLWLSEGADSRPFWTNYGPVNARGFARIPKLDWVIVGGESGSGARPFHVAWAREVVNQCKAAAVPCFVKQLGSRCMDDAYDHRDWPAGTRAHVGITMDAPRWIQLSKKGGEPTEWPEDLRVRQFPEQRSGLAMQVAAVDPHASDPGNPTTRDKGSA